MTVLIVGHTGYVGRNLIRWYASRGEAVAGVSRSSIRDAVPVTLEKEYTFADIGGLDFNQFLGNEVSAMIVLSADTRKSQEPQDVRYLIDVNAALPTELAIRAVDIGVPAVVFASTYSIRADGGEYLPQTLYTASKKAAEDLLEYVALDAMTRITALRIYDIFGPGQPHDRLIPYLISRIKRSEEISITPGLQEMSPVFIDDVCAALHACALEEGTRGTLRIRSAPGPEILRVRDLPARIAHVLDRPLPLVRHDRPERPHEIMCVNPGTPPPAGWAPTVSLDLGIRATSEGVRGWGSRGLRSL